MSKREDGIKVFQELMPDVKGTGKQPANRVAPELGGLSLEYAFGTLWTRPGLDRRSRSLVTLGILIAQKSAAELKYHFAIALQNGITKAEIDEVIYQSTAYAGFPAASEAAHVAQEVFDAQDKKDNK
jgi:4-carboxymuconolactone decarboxylase